MHWVQSAANKLQSSEGYEVTTTAINGKVRWCATSPSRQLLAVAGSKIEAQQHCNDHHKGSSK